MRWTVLLDRLFRVYYYFKFYPFRKERLERRVAGPGRGFVGIQLDGLSAPHLRQALAAGYLPNIARHLKRGYVLGEYRSGLPSTTPAAQGAIFWGDGRGIPAFRWFEKSTGRLISCNDPDHVQQPLPLRPSAALQLGQPPERAVHLDQRLPLRIGQVRVAQDHDLEVDYLKLAQSSEQAEKRRAYEAGEAVESSAAIADGRVFVGVGSGHLLALSLADGVDETRFAARQGLRAHLSERGTSGQAAAGDGPRLDEFYGKAFDLLESGSAHRAFDLRQEPDAVRDRAFDVFPRLHERREQLAGTLSGGEQQMLALSRALATEPALLMLDEISMGLAPLIVAELYEHVARIAHEGIAILLVEQYARMALEVADYAAIMVNGRVRSVGQPADIREELSGAYLGGAA